MPMLPVNGRSLHESWVISVPDEPCIHPYEISSTSTCDTFETLAANPLSQNSDKRTLPIPIDLHSDPLS